MPPVHKRLHIHLDTTRPARPVSNPHRYGQKPGHLLGEEEDLPQFQTLIGTVKSPGPRGLAHREGAVSNPHRYGQKPEDSQDRGPPRVVSNPHRYGQKRGACWRGGGHLGRVSNPHRYGQKGVLLFRLLFFLVGFQTLIGTVKSRPEGHRLGHQGLVSNPHRYGQKAASSGAPPLPPLSFKPS